MNTKMHGKEIEALYFTGEQTEDGNPKAIYARDGVRLHLSATHHGEYDQFWVVASKGDRELGRYNCRCIAEIVWARV